MKSRLGNYTPPCVDAISLAPASRRTWAVFIMNNGTRATYFLPNGCLRLGDKTLALEVRRLNPQMSEKPWLRNMEILVEYTGGLPQV